MSDYFIFDNIDTRNYDDILVYFNEIDTTPKRVGEFIEIPNRNGSFFLDGGRYEDVTHTYDIVALSKEDASDLINALASKVGYFRLQDSFNTDEFYSAIFNSEIKPNITKERDKLTFKVTFTRKPQRWLTSGESVVTVESGDTLTNPTLFESSPLLEVEGYGKIEFNGYEIELENETLGNVMVRDAVRGASKTFRVDFTIPQGIANTGDSGTIGVISITRHIVMSSSASSIVLGAPTVTYPYGAVSAVLRGNVIDLTVRIPITAFVVGTDFTTQGSVDIPITCVSGGGSTVTGSAGYTVKLFQAGSDITLMILFTSYTGVPVDSASSSFDYEMGAINIDSSVPVVGSTIYIDCDLGEAYKIDNGDIINLNRLIDLGSDLPTLASGANTITYDNTITSFKITPRWWKV